MCDNPAVDTESLERSAALLREPNAIDAELAALMRRPMPSGQLSERIDADAFDIELVPSAVAAEVDGRLRSGSLPSGPLDLTESTKSITTRPLLSQLARQHPPAAPVDRGT
jgi:hypothetical protein